MYKKTRSPLYANVTEAKYTNKKLSDQNEPTYYNTMTNKMQRPPQDIYSNVSNQRKPNNLYTNVDVMGKTSYKINRYPLYDNLKPLGLFLNVLIKSYLHYIHFKH